MQNIVIDKPYHFIPPVYGKLWPRILVHVFRWHARRYFGIEAVEMHGMELLHKSIAAGHGIMLRRAGAFSIYREGMDRTALNTAVEMMEKAERPLIVFPEGVVSRTNDRLNTLLDGVALMARSAAKKRAKLNPPGQVVIHPVAIRYKFEGDLAKTLQPVLEDLEHRLSWQSQKNLNLASRIAKVGQGLLALKEIEYMGHAQQGLIYD